MYNIFNTELIMKNVMFKENFIDIDEEFLDDLIGTYRETLGAYKLRLKDAEELASNFIDKTKDKQLINLIISMLAKRSTVGTEELEGYKPNLDKLEKNLSENKLSITDESNVTLDILSSYLEYSLPNGILTIEEIKNIHSLLFNSEKTKYKAGKFRKAGDNNVMNQKANKIYIDSKLVEEHMNRFAIYYNSNVSSNPVTKVAMIHGILLGIHPFKDGNGRLTRFITDKLLSDLLGVPLYLSEAINIESDNTLYGTALDQFHLEGNSLPLIRFFYQITINQLNINIGLIQDWMNNVGASIFKLTKKNISPKYINSLALALTGEAYIHLTELSEKLGVTKVTGKTIINELLEEKLLIKSAKHGRVQLYKVKL